MARRAWKPRSLRWEIAPPSEKAEQLAAQLKTAPLVARMLLNRGIDDPDHARAFLAPRLTDLHDPTELHDTQAAARRIVQAVRDGRKIVLYGDYDVDGMTGVAILHRCLKLFDADVTYYVPHRLDEGYGVNPQAVAGIVEDGAGLMVTVDCGITASEPLAQAVDGGVDVVVTDHHAPGPSLPPAAAIVHPAHPDGSYANPGLCGAGVALKVAWQVAREMTGREKVDDRLREFLLDATCLAALGTIADVVPLVGENRVLAMYGLKGIPASRHEGLRALLESANLLGEKLDAYHVGFLLAPRLNACGRMGHAAEAVELLTGGGADRAGEIAAQLVRHNTDRQKTERQIADQAVEMVKAHGFDSPERRAIVLASEDWHGGVIGIVASRLVDRFAKPAVLIAINGDGCGQGSGRSVPGFNLHAALTACSGHLLSFGGHAMAGGLRIAQDRIDAFAEALGEYAATHLPDESMTPSLRIDAETTLGSLNFPAVRELERMAPFGEGNPRPVVAIRGCRVLSPPKRMGRSGATAGLLLEQNGTRMRAVGFGMGDLADLLVGVGEVDIAAEPGLNHFNGRTSVELKLRDVQW